MPITLTVSTNAAYTLSSPTITIPANSSSGTVTVTAVNNKADAADNSVTLTPTTGNNWVAMPSSGVSLTIKDEDDLAKPTGVRVAVQGTNARVDWTAVTDATSYKVEWSSSSTFAGTPFSATVTGDPLPTNHSITSGLTSGTTYYFRVTAVRTGYDDSVPSDSVSATPTTGNTDYDVDNDGLIEVEQPWPS